MFLAYNIFKIKSIQYVFIHKNLKVITRYENQEVFGCGWIFVIKIY
jgi:hypothetical protein